MSGVVSGILSGPSDLSAVVVQPLSPLDPLEEDGLLTAVVLTCSLTASAVAQRTQYNSFQAAIGSSSHRDKNVMARTCLREVFHQSAC